MKNYILAALLLCSLAYSTENRSSTKQTQSPHHRLYTGPDVFVMHQKGNQTFRAGTINTTFNAVFGGLRLGYDYLKPQTFYFGMDGLAAMGRSFCRERTEFFPHDFFVFLCYGPSPSIKYNRLIKKTPLFANIEQRYGYTFQSPIAAKSTVIPFAGIGWYYIRPQFDSRDSLSNWLYGTAGLRATLNFCENFDIGFNVKAMYAFAGNEKNFWGYEVALPLTWCVGAPKKWDFQFQPYLLKLDIDRTGYFLGVRLQTGYSF